MSLAEVQFNFESTYIPTQRPKLTPPEDLSGHEMLTININGEMPFALGPALERYNMKVLTKPLQKIRWDRISHFDVILIYGNSSADDLTMMCTAIREYTLAPIVIVSDTCNRRSVNLQLLISGADHCLPLNTPEGIIAAHVLGAGRRYINQALATA